MSDELWHDRDPLWHDAVTEAQEMDLLEQARFWGELAAWQYNKIDSTGLSSLVEYRRIQDAFDRRDEIADILGDSAREAFGAGFDEAIDFSFGAEE